MPPESLLVGKIVRAIVADYPSAWILKTSGGPWQRPGIPDLLMCIQGRFIGMEVKAQRPGESLLHAYGRATPQQKLQISLIREAEGTASVIVSVEEALHLIKETLSK